MNKQRKTSHILNVFQYDDATGIIGLNGAPVSGYGLYLTTNINDGSVGIDSSASINALYLLKNTTKQFEISYDTSGATKLFRLLPYQSGSFFQIGNPSNAANSNSDYVFISESVYGNVLIGPGIGNATGNLTGATASIHKVQFNGAVFANNSIQATSFKITGGSSTGFLKADGTVDAVTYLSGNQSITVSGDATGSGTTSIALTLANTAVTPGTYGSTTLVPVVTVDSKGRITSVTTAAISGSLTFTGDVTGSGTTGTSTAMTLAASGVTAGTYTKVTVDTKGRVTVGASATTSDISEGTNLYYTDARVLSYLSANTYATQSYVNTQVSNLVAAAPATLDTLNELAAALGNDPSFATTISTALGNRLRVDINTQGLSATLQGYGRTNLGLGTAATSNTGDFVAYRTFGTAANSAIGDFVAYRTFGTAANNNTGDFALASHTHSIANVTGLQTALDGKQASLGYTPYNSTNPSGYITSSSLSAYLPLTGGTLSGNLYVTNSSTVGAIFISGAQVGARQYMIHNGITGISNSGLQIRDVTGNANLVYFDTGYNASFGAGIWATSGNFSAAISASNFSGTSSGTNTGDQTNISGNAATATTATYASYLNTLGSYVWSSSSLPNTYHLGITSAFVGPTEGWQNYGSVMTMRTYSGGGGSLQLYTPYGPSNGGDSLQVRFGNYNVSSGNSWTSWKTLIDSGNIGSQSVSSATSAGSISGFNNPTTAATANTIVYRDASGDVAAREFVLTAATVHTVTPSSIVGIYPTTNQVVKFSASAIQTFLGLGSLAYSSATIPTNNNQLTNGAGYITGYSETDTLQSVTNRGASTSTSITAADFYTAGWFRNSGVTAGLYNSTHNTHFYASGTGQWNLATSNGSWIQIALRPASHESTVRGYIYADTNNNVGLLTNDGNWGLRVDVSKNVQIYGSVSATNLSGTNTGDQTNISGNAATVTNGVYTNVVNTIVSGDSATVILYGASTYSAAAALHLGGWSTDTTYARIRTSNGNLHIDTRGGGGNLYQMYFNHYSSGDMYFGNGGGTVYMYGGRLKHSNGTDYVYNSGSWSINVSGTAGSISGFNNPTAAATANTIVYRDGNGHITGNYILGSYFNSSAGNSENPTIGQIWTQSTGDNYLRKSTPAHLISQLGLITTSNIGSQSVSFATNATTATNALGIGLNGNAISGMGPISTWDSRPGVGMAGFGISWHTGVSISGYPGYGGVRLYSAGYPTHASSVLRLEASDSVKTYGILYNDTSVRAPIYYDSDDTAYYLNPAGGSRLRNLYVGDSGDDWSDPGGWGTQIRFSNGPHVKFVLHARTPGIEAGMYVHTPGSVFIGSYTSHDVSLMYGGNRKMGFNASYIYTDVYLEAAGSLRAPIFYDSNDTGYYLDPNGTSNLNKLSGQTMAYNDMNPMSANSPYAARYGGSANYRNGTMGYGQVSFNEIFSNWGSGFIDSWSSPGNAPGGSSHYVGHQVAHYNHQNSTNVYGYQMVCAGEADNRFFWRSSWATPRSWVEMWHSGNYTPGTYGTLSCDLLNTGNTINIGYTRNNESVATSAFRGIEFHNPGNRDYYIGKDAGAWTKPLAINFYTGIEIRTHQSYGGTRFHNIAVGLVGSFNDGDNHFRGYYDIIAYASDKRLKHNIKPIENALSKVNSLTGMTYQWNSLGSQHGWSPDMETREVGVFAQDVQAVLPEAVRLAPFDNDKGVSKSGENFLTVKYEKIVPLLIEAIKEQQLQIEELKNKLDNVLSSR